MRHFLDSYCATYRRCIEGVSPQLERLLLEHQWPGNVRELKNCIERAVIFTETGELDVADLPGQYHTASGPALEPLGDAHDHLTRQMIMDALARSAGVKHRAAELLKIHRKTLYNQMKRLGIE